MKTMEKPCSIGTNQVDVDNPGGRFDEKDGMYRDGHGFVYLDW